jgi:protein involved in polysaccharide export with SLBB domain
MTGRLPETPAPRPGRETSVAVSGYVENPGVVVYQKGMAVRDYVRAAGGFTSPSFAS